MTARTYRSTDFGHPIMNGVSGSLINVLRACLVDDYGTDQILSLTQSGGVATAQTENPHGIPVGMQVKRTIFGAAQNGYNVEATVTSTGLNTFTYTVPIATPSVATGGSVKTGGSGWTMPFGQTANKAVFRQPTAVSNGRYLEIDDSAVATVARTSGYEVMTGIGAGSGKFPTQVQFAGGLYMEKSNSASSTEKPWVLYCNEKIFYLVVNKDSSPTWNAASILAFGDFTSYRSGDVYNTLHVAAQSASGGSQFHVLSSASSTINSAHFIARGHAQEGSSIEFSKGGDYFKGVAQSAIGAQGMPYPSPVDGALWVSPVYIGEKSGATSGVPRGVLPGVYSPLHQRPLAHGDIWTPNTGDLVGKSFEAVNSDFSAQIFFEISDTW